MHLTNASQSIDPLAFKYFVENVNKQTDGHKRPLICVLEFSRAMCFVLAFRRHLSYEDCYRGFRCTGFSRDFLFDKKIIKRFKVIKLILNQWQMRNTVRIFI